MVFGAYSNELHEISLLESWDFRGLFWADLLLKDLKRQPLQFRLSNLIRFLSGAWLNLWTRLWKATWLSMKWAVFEGKFASIPEGSAFKFSYEY